MIALLLNQFSPPLEKRKQKLKLELLALHPLVEFIKEQNLGHQSSIETEATSPENSSTLNTERDVGSCYSQGFSGHGV
jgi:hypothetical protein